MRLVNFGRAIFFLVCLATMGGCGLTSFSHRETNPAFVDDTNSAKFWNKLIFESRTFTTYSTTASRRMILVLEDKDRSIVCSEPSPDVGEAFASVVSDSIRAKLPLSGGVSVDLANDYANSINTQIMSLIYRTQGLQLYRNSMHSLCVDRLNGWFDGNKNDSQDAEKPHSYEDFKKYYFDKASELIRDEIKYIKDVSSMKTRDLNTSDSAEKNSAAQK